MQLDRRGSVVRFAGALAMAALLFGCDHATKAAATASLAGAAPVRVVDDLVVLRYVENDDVAFSLMHALGLGPARSSSAILAAVAAAAIVALVVVWRRLRREAPSASASAMIDVGFAAAIAGALGNLVDRVTRGYVVDFIHVKRWPVFNVADILVVAGIALVALARRRKEKTAEEG